MSRGRFHDWQAPHWLWVGFVFLILSGFAPHHASAEIALASKPLCAVDAGLHKGHDRLELNDTLEIWQDQSAESNFEHARAALATGKFAPMPKGNSNIGFVTGTHWFHGRLSNSDNPSHHWVLVVDYSLLDHVDAFFKLPDGQWQTMRSGDRLSFSQRSFAHRRFNFRFDLETGQSMEYFFRVRSESSLQFPLRAETVEHFLQKSEDEQFGLGIYYGILTALLLYNLILFLRLRERVYLAYVAYVGLFGVLQASLNGLAFQYIWPEWPAMANTATPLSIALGLGSMLVFTMIFLDIKAFSKPLHKVFVFLVSLNVLLAVAAFVLPYRWTVFTGTALVFVDIPIIGLAAIWALLRKQAAAKYFLLAWAMFLLGVLVYAAVSFGLVPKMFITEYGIQIGSALEMILLSFSLADRIHKLTQDNARIHLEAREQLETRVQERTLALNDAVEQLRVANLRLHDHAQRDGLTAIFNRRYLDERLQPVWDSAVRSNESIAVAMVDIDHFKQINDQFGHMAGDDCLRLLAGLLENAFGDVGHHLVRYGGEEFLLLVERADPDTLQLRFDQLRKTLMERPIQRENNPIEMTVSVGIAWCAQARDSINPLEMVQAADAALYRAKNAGRNRVEFYPFKERTPI